jgi:hypothetical protein
VHAFIHGCPDTDLVRRGEGQVQTLNSAYAKVGTIPKACQDDAFQPDACTIGAEVKQSTR